MPLLKPPRGIQLNRSHPLARGLVGCWLFNEGTGGTVYDYAGRYGGTVTGTLSRTASKYGFGLKFEGNANNYVSIPSTLSFGTGNFTIVIWFRTADWDSYGPLLETADDVGDFYPCIFIRGSKTDGKLRFLVRGPSSGVSFYSSVSVEDNLWHQVVMTRSGDTVTSYLDGKYDNQGTATIGDTTTGSVWFIGRSYDTTPYVLNAEIDHEMVYASVLSAAEIAHLYREPFCMFQPRVSPCLLSAPAGQTVSLAGTCAAGTDVTASLKVTYRCAGAIAAQSGVSASLTVLGQVALAGAIAAHSGLSASLTVVGQVPPAQEFFAGSLNIEQDWLLGALFGGMTANAFKLGTVLSQGWFWMRRSGCSVLYRGPAMDQIDFTNALTVAEQDAGQISPPLYVAHGSSSTYFYAVRRVNTCGYREHTLAAVAKVAIDADGNLAAPQPNNIFAAGVRQVNGNKVRLAWFYCPLRQKSKPVCFRIYHDAASGQVDYQNPIGTITYEGQRFHSYLTEPLAGGRYLFAILAEDADGVQNGSLARSTIQLVTEIPEAVDILSAESL